MSDDNGESGALLTPGIAAKRLGVSGAALRRQAVAYELVYGTLPMGAGGRLWPVEAVERLREARALIEANRARSVQGALELLQGGAQVPVEVSPALERGVGTSGELVAELRALRSEVEALRREVGELRVLPNVEIDTFSSAQVVEPQRTEQSEWVEEVSRRGVGLGVRRPTDGGAEDGLLVRMARRLESLLRRRSVG